MSYESITSLLSRPETHGGTAPVEVIETHAALVFLTDRHAYKIKRPVKYDYLDFSTPDKRKAMLERELELNRRGASDLYLDVLPITEASDRTLALDGDGTPVEWCLKMRRFAKDAELSAVADRGGLSRDIAESLGCVIACYHAGSETRETDGHRLITGIVDELGAALGQMTDVLDTGDVARFKDRVTALTESHGPLLSERGTLGFVRRGHGDLHLGNLVLLDGRPVPFDALEFDERLGTLDVLYDLAFVLMDLLHRDLSEAANAVMGAYLLAADEPRHLDGLALLPLFLGLRAAIRAMVSVQAGRLADEDARAKFMAGREYLDHALDYLWPPAPRLVAVGGLSGSGKTTLARGLCPEIGPAPGAVHVRSDLERKALFGVDPLTRLPEDAYTREVSDAVYERLLDKAARALGAGHGVVIDAAHLRSAERDRVRELAGQHGVAFTGLWLEADPRTLLERVTARTGDASDADADVVQKQLDAGDRAREWTVIDASGSAGAALDRARAAIGEGPRARGAPDPGRG